MNDYRAYVDCDYNSIYHYGVKGTKWGIRKYQYEDGSLTPEGRLHYKQLAAGAAGMAGISGIAYLAGRSSEKAEQLAKARGTLAKDIERYKKETAGAQWAMSNGYRARKNRLFGKNQAKFRQAHRRAVIANSESFGHYMKRTDPDLFKSVANPKTASKGKFALSKLSKKGKIGLAIGAAALAGAGAYALYKHNKKKKKGENR